MAEIIIIAAVAKNNVIGMHGKIPWHISEDFRHFKEKTTGHPVIMGRNTYESLPDNAKPLPGRENIVITRNPEYHPENVTVKHSLEQALDYCRNMEKVFIIGGAGVYAQALPLADKLELTFIEREYEGDAYFPDVNFSDWNLVSKEEHDGYSFNTFVRKV